MGSLKHRWRELRTAMPGRRFQERYERRHESGTGGLSRFLYLGGGLTLLVVGVFFLPAPGPGTIILLLGAGLIAQEWEWAARALDWLELRIRSLVGWLRRIWQRSTLPLRILIVLLVLVAGVGLAYGGYQLLFAR